MSKYFHCDICQDKAQNATLYGVSRGKRGSWRRLAEWDICDNCLLTVLEEVKQMSLLTHCDECDKIVETEPHISVSFEFSGKKAPEWLERVDNVNGEGDYCLPCGEKLFGKIASRWEPDRKS
jgi:hypothetical protein